MASRSAVSVMENRRAGPRTRVSRKAFAADLDNRFFYYCFIRDASQDGCRLYSPDVSELPPTFWLYPESFRAPLLARIAWRRARMAGIHFIRQLPPELADKAVHKPDLNLNFAEIGRRVEERRALLDRVDGRRTAAEPRNGAPWRAARDHLAIVIHALRKPAAAIAGTLQRFVSEARHMLPRRLQVMILGAARNSERLKRLIGDLLDAGQTGEAGIQVNLVPADLNEMARDAIAAEADFAALHEVTCRLETATDGNARVRADVERMRRALSSLICGAVTASRPGAEVVLRLERTAPRIRVSVAAGTNRNKAPAGERGTLGLAVARSIIEQHGGTLGHDTVPASGAMYHFELPEVETAQL